MSDNQNFTDENWMQYALNLAKQAAISNEVPVGAILVKENNIVGYGANCPIASQDPTAHAEVMALRDAAKFLKNYRLIDTTLYVTLEPCPMCIGAILQARIKRLVYGATDPKSGAIGSVLNLLDYQWNHRLIYNGGVLAESCANILKDFFKTKRTM